MLAPKRNESPIHYWISLWPTAPLFGVKWRFEGVNPAMSFFNPVKVAGDVAKATAEETARAVEDAARATEAQAAAARKAVEDALAAGAAASKRAADKGVETVEAVAEVAGATAEDAAEEEAEAAADAATDGAAEAVASDADATAARRRGWRAQPAPPALIDDLKLIRGVGPKLEMALNDLGVFRFEQLVAFSEADLAWLDDQLSSFRIRPQASDLAAQAKALA
jgi:NADH-quinone oxidoreductase subunit E